MFWNRASTLEDIYIRRLLGGSRRVVSSSVLRLPLLWFSPLAIPGTVSSTRPP